MRLTPEPLSRGATIGIIAPSGRVIDTDRFAAGVATLREMGFNVKYPRELWPGCGYLADSDAERGAELHAIWNDPEVAAVMAARGGFGCLRIAGSLDYAALKQPKLLIGFSDITVLHSCLNSGCGLVSLHGPVVTSLGATSREDLLFFRDVITHDIHTYACRQHVEILRSGTGVGQVTGGNLASVVSLLGTPFAQDWSEKIVLLEDTGESTYKIDRMLTQLHHAGCFEKITGVILGDFCHGLELDSNTRLNHLETVWTRVLELTHSRVPVWAGFPSGHGSRNVAVPLGLELAMDSSSSTLSCHR